MSEEFDDPGFGLRLKILTALLSLCITVIFVVPWFLRELRQSKTSGHGTRSMKKLSFHANYSKWEPVGRRLAPVKRGASRRHLVRSRPASVPKSWETKMRYRVIPLRTLLKMGRNLYQDGGTNDAQEKEEELYARWHHLQMRMAQIGMRPPLKRGSTSKPIRVPLRRKSATSRPSSRGRKPRIRVKVSKSKKAKIFKMLNKVQQNLESVDSQLLEMKQAGGDL